MTTNPSLDRRWIQIHGLPLDPLTGAVRGELDRANSTKVADGAQRVVLFDQDDRPICSIDFAPSSFERIDQVRSKPGEALVKRIGDTIIRPISATDAAAIGTARDYHDPSREVPPIDLPDYDPHADEQNASATSWLLIIALIIAALVAGYLAADHFGLLDALDGKTVAFGAR